MDALQLTVKAPFVLFVGDTVTFCGIGGGGAWVTVTVIVELAPEQVGVMQACARYWYAMHRLDVQGHALRYAFARERIDAYRAQGMPLREALVRASMDFGHGHGDGRGRWVRMVYLH